MNRGAWGEQWAADYLLRSGYDIIAHGYRSRWGEIDLVAIDGEFVVFVEVKMRAACTKVCAREAVTQTKQRRIIRTALCWIADHPKETRQPRFDVIEVYDQFPHTPQIYHWKNAFDAQEGV